MASANWVDGDHLDSALVIVPVTVPLPGGAEFNLNGGWSFVHTSIVADTVFYGAQLNVPLVSDVTMMGEVFQGAGCPVGLQGGLRWTPNAGPLDVDLLAGHDVDEASEFSITIGLTVRH